MVKAGKSTEKTLDIDKLVKKIQFVQPKSE